MRHAQSLHAADFPCVGMVGADLRAARYKPSKRTARPEVGPYRHANQTGMFCLPATLQRR